MWRKLFSKPLLKITIPVGLFLTLGLAAVAYACMLQMTGNFHTVVDGALYRSAQPTPTQIEDYKRDYGIQTIINLRGPKDHMEWYKMEKETAARLGIKHIDFRMSARLELTEPRAIELITLLHESPKPILIHCHSGSDRTGLASALFLAAIANKGEVAAEGQLSFFYGHVAIPLLSAAYEMDRTFEKLEPFLGLDGS